MVATEQKELAIVSQETVVAAAPATAPKSAPSDLRHFSMLMPVAEQKLALAEFKERRDNFREWLRAQLIEGIHYGYPPGCEPNYDKDGNVLIWVKGGTKPYPPKQWTPKPSFYLAGADFVCDLLGLKPEYAADKAAWEQMGSSPNTFVFGCYLRSRANGEIIGEGRGVRQVGQKGGDANNAIKMAMKSAKVAAVLDTYGLRDAFTQDLEDMPKPAPEHENPARNTNAPKTPPRGERLTNETINGFFKSWKAYINPEGQPKDFTIWLQDVTARKTDFTKATNWTPDMAAAVQEELRKAGPPDE